jgi:hypothetical protein
MTRPSPADDGAVAGATADHRPPPTWRQLHPGDDPWGEALQIEHWRLAPPALKMRELAALNALARRLALAGLRQRYPAASPASLQRLLADLLLGADLALAAYGPLPEDIRQP